MLELFLRRSQHSGSSWPRARTLWPPHRLRRIRKGFHRSRIPRQMAQRCTRRYFLAIGSTNVCVSVCGEQLFRHGSYLLSRLKPRIRTRSGSQSNIRIEVPKWNRQLGLNIPSWSVSLIAVDGRDEEHQVLLVRSRANDTVFNVLLFEQPLDDGVLRERFPTHTLTIPSVTWLSLTNVALQA